LKKRLEKMTPITYPLKIQAIRSRGQKPRLYVSFPLALAAAIGINPGDPVQWELLDRGELHLVLLQPRPAAAKAKRRSANEENRAG
jgi:hypothetical protein